MQFMSVARTTDGIAFPTCITHEHIAFMQGGVLSIESIARRCDRLNQPSFISIACTAVNSYCVLSEWIPIDWLHLRQKPSSLTNFPFFTFVAFCAVMQLYRPI